MRGFSDHLNAPLARGHAPADAAVGAAGGAACGDLLRLSVRVDGDCVADAGFDARGCGAAIAAGSAAVALVRGATLLDAARVSADAISAELGGLSTAKRHAADLAADALHRALGAAAAEQASLDRVEQRTLVAMSGGVDSAVAALRCAEEGGEIAAVTVELWADPEHDAERSCCSPAAVTCPPPRSPAFHAGPAQRVSRRRRGSVHRGARGGGDAEPVCDLQRSGSA